MDPLDHPEARASAAADLEKKGRINLPLFVFLGAIAYGVYAHYSDEAEKVLSERYVRANAQTLEFNVNSGPVTAGKLGTDLYKSGENAPLSSQNNKGNADSHAYPPVLPDTKIAVVMNELQDIPVLDESGRPSNAPPLRLAKGTEVTVVSISQNSVRVRLGDKSKQGGSFMCDLPIDKLTPKSETPTQPPSVDKTKPEEKKPAQAGKPRLFALVNNGWHHV